MFQGIIVLVPDQFLHAGGIQQKLCRNLIKPLNIIKNLIENSSRPGDLVLDPFLGSGTTAAACLELGRNYLGYEINPEYFGIAEKRILDTRAAERMIKNTQNQE